MGSKYKHCFMGVIIKSENDWPAIEKRMGAGFPLYNNIAHYNGETCEWRMFNVGDTFMVQEPVFIPRAPDTPEGDGFVIALVSRYETFSSDIIIIDTRDWAKPAAVVKLPCKLRPGIHGNWVDASETANKITNGATLVNGGAHATTNSVIGSYGGTNGTRGL
jgi:carotenoid cleavage dioxygenase-like enzyme